MTRLLSLVIGMSLITAVWGASVVCRASDHVAPTPDAVKTVPNPAPVAKEKEKPNPKLKGDMEKLLSDAKAGKVAPRAQQTNYPKRNNLSTGAKIGIIAAIAGGIFAIWVIHTVNSD
jgi:hypothetical protein